MKQTAKAFLLLGALSLIGLASCRDHLTDGGNNDSTNTTGTANYALAFSGGGEHVVVPNNSTLHLANQSFTVETWVSVTPNSYFQGFVDKRSFPVVGDYWLGLDRTNVFRFMLGNYQVDLYGRTTPTRGIPYHVAAVVDHNLGNVSLYVNGVLDAYATLPSGLSVTESDAPIYLGADKTEQVPNSENLTGMLDETRIWSTARSQAQIQDGMHVRASGLEPALVACWHFDEGRGMTAKDASPNHNDGTFSRAIQWTASPVQ